MDIPDSCHNVVWLCEMFLFILMEISSQLLPFGFLEQGFPLKPFDVNCSSLILGLYYNLVLSE